MESSGISSLSHWKQSIYADKWYKSSRRGRQPIHAVYNTTNKRLSEARDGDRVVEAA